MSKNANFVSHKKSKQKNQDGSPKLPVASALVEGEIAVNFGKDVETLSIKNESGDVVTFSSDNYYTEKKLGSGFTGENSGVTVTEAIENSEKAVYKAVIDNELVWTNAFVALSGVVSAHTENTEIHVTAADKARWNSSSLVHYSKVSVTGNLTNVTCPVTLATNGEQCNVLYVNNSTEHTVSVSTNYKSPDNSQINLTIKANGYAEVNYLYFDGDIYVRAM